MFRFNPHTHERRRHLPTASGFVEVFRGLCLARLQPSLPLANQTVLSHDASKIRKATAQSIINNAQ